MSDAVIFQGIVYDKRGPMKKIVENIKKVAYATSMAANNSA